MGVLASSSVVAAQSFYLLANYKPLPPPLHGPLRGVERWAEKEGVPGWVKGIVRRLSERHPKEGDGTAVGRPSKEGAGDEAARRVSFGWGRRFWTGREAERATKRIVIIGDSLVVGIGCKEAPVMPKAICGRLAELLQVDVQWRALGVDGGDVRTIHSKVLEAVDDAVHLPKPVSGGAGMAGVPAAMADTGAGVVASAG
eukprot:CAMPEP_0173384198 /NCGR_PEP_ID=MMETSP1356-20130122/6766_1 /TAXON_ID=77927 ORGANISM="Hemiselmis virescens, Strain PCC157" /NCGR_SAMPLE_ID=MMETSP1356 /ASSEMBLY_ACC=CAM_ASM_000847 /LENGTH=198 /DNA_ID=CAMNT_0014339423 /DNA_START=278 /DNA_END=870 /DNA_ORIENTATION=+